MKRTFPVILLAALFAFAGALLSDTLSKKALATRSNTGAYSLPAGNPVVTGTTITTSWANNTLNDIGTELTNSVDRLGRGGMLAPLKLPAGSVSAPALTWSADTMSGLYRAAAGDYRFSTANSDSLKFNSAGVVVPGTLLSVGDFAVGDGGFRVVDGGNVRVAGTVNVAGGATFGAIAAGQLLDDQASVGSIAITNTTDQPELHFCDFAADAGSKCARIIFDPGGSLPINKPGWVFQASNDDGGFVSNGLILYRDGSLGIGPGNGTAITASYGARYTISVGTLLSQNCLITSESNLSSITQTGVCNVSANGNLGFGVFADCYPTAPGTFAIRVCNPTASSIVVGSQTFNVRFWQP